MRTTIFVSEERVKTFLNVVPPSPSAYAGFFGKFFDSTPPAERQEALKFLDAWVGREKRRWPTRRERFVSNYLAYALTIDSGSSSGEGWQLPARVSRGEAFTIGDAVASAYLRQYVDEWLDTGRYDNGREVLKERNLGKAIRASRAFWEYLENAPPKVSADLDGSDIYIHFAERSSYKGKVKGFFEATRVEAQRVFSGIMMSDWKDRLCKCRYGPCGAYFVLERPRMKYKNGTFCESRHAKSAAAAILTQKLRSGSTATLIDQAARILRRRKIVDSSWQQGSEAKRRLAVELCSIIVNQGLQYPNEVKVHWVTLHQQEIEQRRCEISSARWES